MCHLWINRGVGRALFIGNLNDVCVGHYEIEPLICKKFKEDTKCIHTNGKLENMYAYQAFQFMW